MAGSIDSTSKNGRIIMKNYLSLPSIISVQWREKEETCGLVTDITRAAGRDLFAKVAWTGCRRDAGLLICSRREELCLCGPFSQVEGEAF